MWFFVMERKRKYVTEMCWLAGGINLQDLNAGTRVAIQATPSTSSMYPRLRKYCNGPLQVLHKPLCLCALRQALCPYLLMLRLRLVYDRLQQPSDVGTVCAKHDLLASTASYVPAWLSYPFDCYCSPTPSEMFSHAQTRPCIAASPSGCCMQSFQSLIVQKYERGSNKSLKKAHSIFFVLFAKHGLGGGLKRRPARCCWAEETAGDH